MSEAQREAGRIARLMGRERDARLVPMSVADVSLRAPRPQFAALSNEKLSRIVPMPTWQDSLKRYLTDGPGVRGTSPARA